MMTQSEMALYAAEAEAERDRILAEFVLAQAEGYELFIIISDDEVTDDEQSLSAW